MKPQLLLQFLDKFRVTLVKIVELSGKSVGTIVGTIHFPFDFLLPPFTNQGLPAHLRADLLAS